MLATDGVVRGLIGPREPQRLWRRHILTSAAVGSLIGGEVTVVDIGSGAGLPGIPLVIARPDLSVLLVEPLERRVRFLLEVVAELSLAGCRVVRGRAEDVVAECGNADVVTSRAVAPLHRLAAWSAPLARDGGLLLALKGASAAEELERDRAAVAAAGLVDAEVLRLPVGGRPVPESRDDGGPGTEPVPEPAAPTAAPDGSAADDNSTFVIRARRAVRPVRRGGRSPGRADRRPAGR